MSQYTVWVQAHKGCLEVERKQHAEIERLRADLERAALVREQIMREMRAENERLRANQKLTADNAYSEEQLAARCARLEADNERLWAFVQYVMDYSNDPQIVQRARVLNGEKG